jgi:hypothetical protein
VERDISAGLKPGDYMPSDARRPRSQETDQLSILEMIETAFGLAAIFADHGHVVKVKAAASLRRNFRINLK